MWSALSVNSGTLAISAVHARAKVSRSASLPVGCGSSPTRHVWLLHRPDQADAPLDLAVVEHELLVGICTAARPDWLLTRSTARGSAR